jgi:oligoribonuclease (3'-5' exoribonuclease)
VIAWVDVETTGLDERVGHLLEVGVVLTDDDLVPLTETSVVVKPRHWLRGHAREHLVLEADDPSVVCPMHEESGLVVAIDAVGVGRMTAESQLVAWVEHAVAIASGLEKCVIVCRNDVKARLAEIPLAGSDVGFDRRWLRQHMPSFYGLFHRRSIDVSSVTWLARQWARPIYDARPRQTEGKHRALPDARGSLLLLDYYRRSGFLGGGAS